ncbi:ABC transporter permease [Sedimentibacter sp. zth1]|uniref:ABC transporter permease n=1 Tax=Sedimentibacter sp. zth1 TaxID=2816908 RepID=UPI001A92EFB1|nr:ABC transporter permease [Sedimentibacter sp. zth1]QSX04716.1 ABC transporter permease [Sedimentibacter sp. zth1]
MWELLEKSEKNAEKVERPSLTYWQDAWRRLKLNKVAVFSLAIIVLILLIAIIVPFLWPIKYTDQVLEFANTPPRLKIYDLGDGNFIYVTNENRVIEITEDGKLIKMAQVILDDKENRMYEFKVGDNTVVVDYSPYYLAKKELIQIKKKARHDSSIDVIKEEQRVENISRSNIYCNDQMISVAKTVWNKTYKLGTDSLGRDMFIRLVYGARISLTVGIAAAIMNFFIGVLYGGISGYFGGRTDNIMMRIVDTISSIPMLLYVILLAVLLDDTGIWTIILAMSLTYWESMARLVRGEVLSLKEQEFILAAQTIGASTKRILLRHLVPNIMGPVMVSITMQIPAAIFTEAFLSFIGLGVSAPMASWGKLCNDALSSFLTYPYQLFFPAIAISITILAFNLLGDGLRDALDPKLRK